jgi:hypothetical protein
MKRIILALLLIHSITLSFGQSKVDTSKHLTFKGVPIDGSIRVAASKIQAAGFSKVSLSDGIAILKGDFASYRDCQIAIVSDKEKDLVYQVIVLFPKKENWAGLSSDYTYLKSMLTDKYGKPASVIEKFDGSYQPTDDSMKYLKTEMDQCKYVSEWELNQGNIRLTINNSEQLGTYVILIYVDKINVALVNSKALDDL